MIPAALLGLLFVPDSPALAPAPQASRNIVTTLFGGFDGERVQGVSMLASGKILIAGSTGSDFLHQSLPYAFPNPPPPNNFYDTSHDPQGGSHAYVAVLEPDMTAVLYWTYLDGSDGDRAYFAMEGPAPARDIYVVGFTRSSTTSTCGCTPTPPMTTCQPFPVKPASNCYDPGPCDCGSCFDIFVAKLSFNLKTLHYSTIIGGGHTQNPRGSMTVASDGSVYVSARTNSPDLPVTLGMDGPQGVSCDPTDPSDPNDPEDSLHLYDAYLFKLDTNGTVLWSTYFGGSGSDHSNANVRLDESDPQNPVIFIAGATTSDNLHSGYLSQLPPGYAGYQDSLRGTTDAFIAKFDGNDGNLLGLTYFGGSGWDIAGVNDCLELDPRGRPVLCGMTRSTDLPVTSNAWNQGHSLGNPQQTDPNSNDVFVAILTDDLTGLVYASYINSTNQDDGNPPAVMREEPSGLAVDPLGNIYVTGETDSEFFPVTSNAFDDDFTNSGERDCFILKLYPGISSASMLLYSSFFGGDVNAAPNPPPSIEAGSRGRGLQFISSGSSHLNKLLFGGSTTTSDFPTTGSVMFSGWLSNDKQQGFVSVHDAN